MHNDNNDKPIDDIAATLRTWSEKLTVGFAAAGLHCEYHSHTGSSGVRLGRLTVNKPGVPDIHYFVDFERKLVIKRGERRLITQLEVFNPVGGLHVHINKFSDATVAKIVAYAKQSIETKQAREALDADRRRGAAGADIYRREFAVFPMPGWARAMPNVESEADTGTFRLLFGDNRSDWPLNRLTPAQVKQVVDAIRAVTCPSEAVKPSSPWHTSSEPVPPELVNDPRSYTGITKMLLLCVDFQPSPVRGWYYGGLLNEFRMEGSPSTVKPTHWMPLPEKPEGVCA